MAFWIVLDEAWSTITSSSSSRSPCLRVHDRKYRHERRVPQASRTECPFCKVSAEPCTGFLSQDSYGSPPPVWRAELEEPGSSTIFHRHIDMPQLREIRADFDRDTIVVYQAFCATIADAAIAASRFVAPFSLGRMTWIKPSFLWLMERSNWARKPNQERILAIRITRMGWETALAMGELTSFEPNVHERIDAWRSRFDQAPVHVQWDPERSLRGKKLGCRSIQVGLSRHVIRKYVEEWTVEIRDLTATATRIRRLCDEGAHDRARRLLPRERTFEVPEGIAYRLGMRPATRAS